MIDLNRSVVLIDSQDADNHRFGTGFVIYKDQTSTFIVTCAHVIEDIGGESHIRVEGHSASSIALSRPDLDMAVLQVHEVLDKEPLHLSMFAYKGISIVMSGFQKIQQKGLFITRQLEGRLGGQIELVAKDSTERIKAWDIEVHGDYYLQPGYSGAPVVSAITGDLFCIISHRQDDQGRKGLAISVENIPLIWSGIPAELFRKISTSTSNEDLRLYGRDDIIADTLHLIRQHHNCRILIRGVSGIGKSALLRQLHNELIKEGSFLCSIYEIESSAHAPQYILSILLNQILTQIAASDRYVRVLERSLFNIGQDRLGKITISTVHEATKIFPTINAPIINSIVQSVPLPTNPIENQDDEAAKLGEGEFLAGFLKIASSLATEGIKACIFLDRIEASSQAVQSVIRDLAIRLPLSWVIIIACNDETTEGLQTLDHIWPQIAYAQGLEIRLTSLSLSALEEWARNVRGTFPHISELWQVLKNCDGRPLFLRDWVDGLSVEATKSIIRNRIGAYYNQRIQVLSAYARQLLRFLSIIPSRSAFSFQICDTILNARSNTPFDTYEILTELENTNFIERDLKDTYSYRFIHDITQRYIFEQLPEQLISTGANALLEALDLELNKLTYKETPQLYIQVMLLDLAGHSGEILELALPTAEKLSHHGSYTLAKDIYEICLKNSNKCGSSELSARSKMGLALVSHDMGYYDDALSTLDNIDLSGLPPFIRANVLSLQGKVLLRMNKYESSLSKLREAYKIYESINDVSGLLSIQKCENIVLRDLGRYGEAVDQARNLVKLAQENNAPPLILASSYRALARSLAFTPDVNNAVAVANDAFNIAVSEGSIREEGNAHLALGEAYRHGSIGNNSLLEQAITNYKTAIEIGESISNRDSVLWSALGLSDALLLLGRIEESLKELGRVGNIVAGAKESYPLEFSHWCLSKSTIDYTQGLASKEELLASTQNYDTFDIQWPRKYVEKIIEFGRAEFPKTM